MTEVYEKLRADQALTDACRRFHVRRLDLFGSAATGNGFDPDHSDVDVLVSFDSSVSGHRAEAWFGLLEVLERVSGRSVDLLTPESLRNPYLRRRVEAELRPLFQAE
jgi:predicted nucleotidyltransferase